jgi:hypothetical protein
VIITLKKIHNVQAKHGIGGVKCRGITGTSFDDNILKGVGIVSRLLHVAATLPRHATTKTVLSGCTWIGVQLYNTSAPLPSVGLAAAPEEKMTASARQRIEACKASTAGCGSWYLGALLRGHSALQAMLFQSLKVGVIHNLSPKLGIIIATAVFRLRLVKRIVVVEFRAEISVVIVEWKNLMFLRILMTAAAPAADHV